MASLCLSDIVSIDEAVVLGGIGHGSQSLVLSIRGPVINPVIYCPSMKPPSILKHAVIMTESHHTCTFFQKEFTNKLFVCVMEERKS